MIEFLHLFSAKNYTYHVQSFLTLISNFKLID